VGVEQLLTKYIIKQRENNLRIVGCFKVKINGLKQNTHNILQMQPISFSYAE
jgi:hypothetical protein